MSYGYMRNASAIYQQYSVRGGVEDADAHAAPGVRQDDDLDVVADQDGVAHLPTENQHPGILARPVRPRD